MGVLCRSIHLILVFLKPLLFLRYITNLPDDIACNIAIFADDNALN